jgi:uncharacterized protein (TIGR03437 family)
LIGDKATMRYTTLLLAASTAAVALGQTTGYPEMTLIRGGEFEMGDHAGFVDPQHPSDEVPLHNVWVDSFYIGTFHVTNRQYIDFLNSALAQGAIEVRAGLVYRKGAADIYCDTRQSADWSPIAWDSKAFSLADARGDHPAVGLRWFGAAAYTNWLSTQLGLQACYDPATWKCDFTRNGYRLPTEAEWEYAARGGQYSPYYIYPWGNDADPARANWPISPANPFQTGLYPWTTPAGFFDGSLRAKSDFAWPSAQLTYQTKNGANAYGLHDMAGNVWQYVHDWYAANYYSVSPSRNPTGPDSGSVMPDGLTYRGMRGGNWYNGDLTDPGHARVSNRNPSYFRGPQDPNHPYYHLGFRVARPAPPATTMLLLPGTGQGGRFASSFGQDSDYALNPPAFSVNGDGTVTDLVTGLVWQQGDSAEMTVENAALYCKALRLGGATDWRLPFAHESFSILNHAAVNPALDTTVFTKSSAEYWWTSDQRADDATRIWVTNAGGGIGPHPKSETISAGGSKRMATRCVRSAIVVDSLRRSFADNGDGTTTDNHTGLMWQKADSGSALTWEDALKYSESLVLAGYDDWRLPNVKELQSINDERLTSPSLDRTVFAGTLPAELWTSTTQINQSTLAWTVDFAFGIVSYRVKTDTLRVRAVRGGAAGLSVVSAASFNQPLAPDSLASAFSRLPLPADAAVTLRDAAGRTQSITPLARAGTQLNFVLPPTASLGTAWLSIAGAGGQPVTASPVHLERVAPAIFTANADGKGVAAGVALTVAADGTQSTQAIFDQNAPAGSRTAIPIDIVQPDSQVYLLLFGTGMRNASERSATIGGVEVPVAGPEALGQDSGLDRVNLGPLPSSLAGKGDAEIVLTVDGKTANRVTVNLK